MPRHLEKAQELAKEIKKNFAESGVETKEMTFLSDYDETLKKSVAKNGEIKSELIEEGIELLAALHFAGIKVAVTTHTGVPVSTKERINNALAKYGLSEKNIPIVTRQDLSDKSLKDNGLEDGKRVKDEDVIQERGKHKTDLMAQIARKKLFGNEGRPKRVVVMGDDDNDCLFAVNIKKGNRDTKVKIVLVNLVRNELKIIKEKRQEEVEQEEKQKVQQKQNKKGKSGIHLYLHHMRCAFTNKKTNGSDIILKRYERILDEGYEQNMENVKNHALRNEIPVIVCDNYNDVVNTLTKTNFLESELEPSTPSTSVQRTPSTELLIQKLEDEKQHNFNI